METISAVILTRNEKKNIKDCIKSLQFADEIIVIDDNSIDQTTEIAKQLGAKVNKRSLKQNYADQRNFGLNQAKGEWVIFIDADERVTEKLSKEIIDSISENNFSSYYIRRQDYFLGRQLKFGETSKVKLLRLAKKRYWKMVTPCS